jgi:hypothetical protein
MTLMLSTPLTGLRILNIRPAMWTDWPVIASLIGLDVAARILPHAPDFTPVAATALFAACVLRFRLLSILVPIAAMLIGDAVLGFYDLKVLIVVYGALALPACAACLSSSLRRPMMTVPMLAASSLTFFLLTNFAVWAFTPMYAATAAGLIKCYVAALLFLQNMLAGDVFWGFALFGPYWLWRTMRAPRAAIAA